MAGWQTQGMIAYQLTSLAVDDLFEIWSYIAHDNPEAANAVEEAIYRACALLAQAPLAGRTRPDLTNLPLVSGLSSLTAIMLSSMIPQPSRCGLSECSMARETSQPCCPDSASPM
jgi:plasmid stabilization system protein ParE